MPAVFSGKHIPPFEKGGLGGIFNHRLILAPFIILFTLTTLTASADDDFARQRSNLLKQIAADVRQTADWLGRKELDARVMNALDKVPRHEFIPKEHRSAAYHNRPLPIGYGQTISQPYIVAIMTDLLDLQADDVVFELGTGSGYQAAVLAELVKQVYSVEIVTELGGRSQRTLRRLGYSNIKTRIGDGYYGWPEHAPFDAIIVTAAGDHIPPPLVQQLKPGGRMIIPVGSAFLTQQLMLIEKQDDASVRSRALLPVRFVPITGGH